MKENWIRNLDDISDIREADTKSIKGLDFSRSKILMKIHVDRRKMDF